VGSAVFALSIHADYRCRHSGACCSADWDVPVELPIYRSLSDALASGRLRVAPAAASLQPFIVEAGLPDAAAAIIERTDRGGCVFFERGSHLCVVHRDLGEQLLPSTFRHFPRVAVRDGRGIFITLSHFCPTAASALFRDDVPVEIVAEPPAFPSGDYEGLVVAPKDLPPLLHPRMLMDLQGYTAWERHMVARCADLNRAPESVMATLARDARIAGGWKPGEATFAEIIAALPPEYVDAPAHDTLESSLFVHAETLAAVPADLRPGPDEIGLDEAWRTNVLPVWDGFRAPANRYLAAKAFASWTAYQGSGVATIVRGLEAALALVRVEAARQCRNAGGRLDPALMLEAFRAADFILNHLAVGEDLAAAWSAAEV
jgi:hypothetical protein